MPGSLAPSQPLGGSGGPASSWKPRFCPKILLLMDCVHLRLGIAGGTCVHGEREAVGAEITAAARNSPACRCLLGLTDLLVHSPMICIVWEALLSQECMHILGLEVLLQSPLEVVSLHLGRPVRTRVSWRVYYDTHVTNACSLGLAASVVGACGGDLGREL